MEWYYWIIHNFSSTEKSWINFYTLISEFDANLYFGGDNVIFWGPLAWTVIYGLFIATFLTLVIVPILFFLVTKLKLRLRSGNTTSEEIPIVITPELAE